VARDGEVAGEEFPGLFEEIHAGSVAGSAWEANLACRN
jgi:hypothetical protein